MSSAQLTIVTESDLDKNLASSNLAVESVQSLKAAFQPHFSAFSKLATAAQAIPKDAPKAARAMRLEMRAIRLNAEKTRKELNEDSAARTKAVNGLNHLLLYALSPIEKYLQEIEDAEEIAEKARLDALRNTRATELSKYTELPGYDLSTIPQAQYDLILLGAKTAYEAKLKAEADRIEAERVAAIQRAEKEKADAAERERLRIENEKLVKAAQEAEAARKEAEAKVAAERKAAQEKVDKEKAERDAAEKVRIAKEAAEKKKLADEAAAKQRAIEEAARKEKEASQKKADEERKKREALEAEIKRREKEEADKKAAEIARIEAEKAAIQAAQEQALKAPDADKLRELAKVISNISIPVLTSKAGKTLSPKLAEQVKKFARWVNDEASKL